MSKRKVFSIICLPLTVFLIVNMFLPFLTASGYGVSKSYSFWEYLSTGMDLPEFGIVIIVELVIAALLFLLQLCGVLKDAKFASLGLGYYFTYHLNILISAIKHGGLEQYSVAFWLGFIISMVVIILLIIGSCVSNERKQRSMYGNNYRQPSGYDPYTGQPIYR